MIILSILVVVMILMFVFLKAYPDFGRSPDKKKLRQFKQSKNYLKGKFRYPMATRIDYSLKALKPVFLEYWKGNPNKRPRETLPIQRATTSTLNNTDTATVTWLGHSTSIIQLDGQFILIDPVFEAFSSPFKIGGRRYSGHMPIEIEDLPEIDVVLISHDHFDHLEYRSINKLRTKVDKFLVPLGVGSHLERWGVHPERIIELDWWESVELDGITFNCTPAKHSSGRGIFKSNTTLWSSWVLAGNQAKIFFSGDSGYGPHFKDIGDKYGPFDLTLIEAGQYDNSGWWPMHMLPEETIQAHIEVRGNLLLPIHWGAFTLAIHDWDDPIERILRSAQERDILVAAPRIGETVMIGKSNPSFTPWWRS